MSQVNLIPIFQDFLLPYLLLIQLLLVVISVLVLARNKLIGGQTRIFWLLTVLFLPILGPCIALVLIPRRK
jgi:hypothetical protein